MREIAGKVIDPNLMKAFEAVVERKQVLVFVREEAGPRSSTEIPENQEASRRQLGRGARPVTTAARVKRR